MGASISTNSQNVVIGAVSKVAGEIVQKSFISTNSRQIVYVSDNIGQNVVIRNNKFTQRVNVNIQALLNALQTEEAQQKLAVELAQQAKSLTSGLNIGQVSVAQNRIDTFINASIEVVSKIKDTCLASVSATQGIIVEKSSASSIVIENNVFDQVADIISSCVANATSTSKSVQDATAKLSQTASATSQGLSEWAIALAIALVVGVPVVGGVVGGVAVLKHVFPLLVVAGVVCMVAYFTATTTRMSVQTYHELVASCPGAVGKDFQSETIKDVSDACLADKDCVAFDWKSSKIGTLFSSVGCSETPSDTAPMVRPATIFHGVFDIQDGMNPTTINELSDMKPGDAYVDARTGIWYQLVPLVPGPIDEPRLEHRDYVYHVDSDNHVRISSDVPTPKTQGVENEIYIFTDSRNPEIFHVFKYVAGSAMKWIEKARVPGPGMISAAPPVTHASGFKIREKRRWLLFVGIGAIILGAVGTAYAGRKSQDMTRLRL